MQAQRKPPGFFRALPDAPAIHRTFAVKLSQPGPSSSSSDRLADAIAAVAMEDRGALEGLYALSSGKLFGICLRICGERPAAEDVLQDVYLTIWRRAGSYDRSLGSPMAWLGTIARNRAIDWRRANRTATVLPIERAGEIADPQPVASDRIVASEETRRLLSCLEGLEDRQRSAIRAAFFDGFTYAELAVRAAVPLGTMKSWVRRGLIRLKGCLDGAD